MTKNLIPIICEELGVEIGEEFEVKDYGHYRFTETVLEYRHSDGTYAPAVLAFNRLVEHEIVKLPFEPELDELYWTYMENWEIMLMIWTDSFQDYARKKLGVVFRSQNEAKRVRPYKYKELTNKEWKERE